MHEVFLFSAEHHRGGWDCPLGSVSKEATGCLAPCGQAAQLAPCCRVRALEEARVHFMKEDVSLLAAVSVACRAKDKGRGSAAEGQKITFHAATLESDLTR
ncbi:UNVERIFIED_CONTAM: hypothetical protein K2H54_015223 [Gekko kuhli]